MEISQVCSMDDLRTLKHAGATQEELMAAHAQMPQNQQRRDKLTDELTSLWSAKITCGERDQKFDELVRGGANVDALIGGVQPVLNWAVWQLGDKHTSLLIEYGANVNVNTKTPDGAMSAMSPSPTPLYLACVMQNESTVDILLEAGADPDRPCGDGQTPAHIVGRTGNIELMKKLVAKGANLNAEDKYYDRPLDEAKRIMDRRPYDKKYVQMYDFLVEQGATSPRQIFALRKERAKTVREIKEHDIRRILYGGDNRIKTASDRLLQNQGR